MKNQKLNIKNKKLRDLSGATFVYKGGAGVTLIELVVVLAVFMLIIGVSVSVFISIIQRQKDILRQQEFLNQISYVTEYMSRTIRESLKDTTGNCLSNNGYIYLLTHYNSAAGFYEGIKFITKDNVCQEFFLDTDGVLKEIKNAGAPQNILSSKFKIKYVRFVIGGNKNLQIASENDLVQPRITISMDIETNMDGNRQEKVIQTTISQKDLNVK